MSDWSDEGCREAACELILADIKDYAAGATRQGDPILDYQIAMAKIVAGGVENVGHTLVCVAEIAAMLVEDLARANQISPLEMWDRLVERGPRP
jgi:hypothetical protein